MAREVRVWDPVVRVAHWGLATSIALAWISGDAWGAFHQVVGYAAAGIVTIRILWGFVGSRHARFTDFVRSPVTVVGYVKDVLSHRERRYLGHNPAGGAMIVALLATIVGLGFTGWLSTTDAYWGSETVQYLHEALANLLLGLVGLHLAGVLFTSIREGENLVHAMVTGRKRAVESEARP